MRFSSARLLANVGASDLDDYLRRAGADPLPRLVVIVDELRTLVDSMPGVVDRLVRLAAQGRSLGMHLVLATQRPAGTVTAEIRANVNLRIAFRVRDHADSLGVVDDGRAAELPAHLPGRAVVRDGDGKVVTMQSALVRLAPRDGPRVEIRSATAGSADDRGGPDGAGDRTAETRAVVDVIARATVGDTTGPVGRPWLPPLPDRLDRADTDGRTVALGDDPDRQSRPVLRWSPDVPLWRIVGPARSGRTTTARAVVLAATSVLTPAELHVHVLAGGDEHDDLRALPHVGTVARVEDTAAVLALVDRIDADVATSAGPAVLVVVDGWERLVEAGGPRIVDGPAERLQRLFRDRGPRIVGVLAGGRDLLRAAWSGLDGEILLLGRHDPLDLALAGVHGPAHPLAVQPGRGLRVRDGLELQVVDASAPLAPASADDGPGGGPHRPWEYVPLPTTIRRGDLAGTAAPAGLLLGVGGPEAAPRTWDPAVDGRRLLVLGPPRSGRSATLRALARSAVDLGAPVVLVGSSTRGHPDTDLRPPWPVVGPADVERLVELRSRHPDLLVLVDDADRLDDAPVRTVLAEITDRVDRDGGAVAVVSTPASLRTRFRGLDVDVGRHGYAVLLRPGAGDAEAVGLPAVPSVPSTGPGRGFIVTAAGAEALQVLAPDDAPSPHVAVGRHG